MAFYKINTEEGGLFYAPNFVFTESRIKITKDDKDKTQTVDGWKWFETEAEAYSYFNVPLSTEDKSILQAKLALQNAGMLDQVSFTDQARQDKWDKADIKTETPILTEVATQLGMTEDQKKAAFEPVETETKG